MSKNTGTVLIALLTGVALGTAAGILFAPHKGTKTREKIKGGYDDSKKQLADKYDEIYDKVKSKFAKVPKDFSGIVDELVSKYDFKKEEIIETLEKKLHDLKKKEATAKN